MNSTKPPRFYTVDQVAYDLCVSTKTVRRRINDGDLKAHRMNRLLRISEDDLRAFIALRRM